MANRMDIDAKDFFDKDIAKVARAALAEDIGSGDLSAPLLPNESVRAQLYCREPAVVCGQAWFWQCFYQCNKNNGADEPIDMEWLAAEGEWWDAPTRPAATVFAPAKTIVAAERTALNFLQTLSATATAARHWQQQAGNSVAVVDTRKTLPLLRAAQKYAVRVGGAHNHRHGLFDEILIKENHLAAAGMSIKDIIAKAKTLVDISKLQIEVRDKDALQAAIDSGARRILLDNFSAAAIKEAVAIAAAAANNIELEASGGIDESKIRAIAQTGVARISIGALTKNLRATDYSLIIE